jgi:hypothetical protein
MAYRGRRIDGGSISPFGEAAANRVAQQQERGNPFLDAGVLALGKNALLFGRRVRFAVAVAAGRLNLAGEPADVAFELHQLVVMIGERLFEALAAQLAPLGLGGVGSLLPDGRERRDFGLVRRFAGRDVGDHRRVARRAICVATEREVFSDGLADHFQLGGSPEPDAKPSSCS